MYAVILLLVLGGDREQYLGDMYYQSTVKVGFNYDEIKRAVDGMSDDEFEVFYKAYRIRQDQVKAVYSNIQQNRMNRIDNIYLEMERNRLQSVMPGTLLYPYSAPPVYDNIHWYWNYKFDTDWR